MPLFPSIEWFESVRQIANRDQSFLSLGTADCRVGVKVGERVFTLEFEAFECSNVSEVEEYMLLDVDFYLDMSPEMWRSLLTNIQQNHGADSEHTLNTLDIQHGIVASSNPYGRNNFPRFHLTVQRFFDLSSQVETEFEQGG